MPRKSLYLRTPIDPHPHPLPTNERERGRGKVIPIADLAHEYRLLRKDIDAAVKRVLESGSYILGQECARFEGELARYIGVKQAIGVNSGTDAILLALRALNILPGDEIIIPAMTFIATAEPILLLGARPVFADIHPDTYALDANQVSQRLTSKTKAVIAVHLYGQPADMTALLKITRTRNVALVEDMAQAIGSEHHGQKSGTFGVLSCLSFYPTKNLGACGDSGAVLTSDGGLADRLRKLRNHGAHVKYGHEEIGYNTRLDELQAAILRIKLTHLETWTRRRITLAAEYRRLLGDLPIKLPACTDGTRHVYHLYSIATPRRDALRKYLEECGVQTGMHYPTPLHLQRALGFLGGKAGDFPMSERLARETLSLPLYPQLTKQDVGRVAGAIRDFFRTAACIH